MATTETVTRSILGGVTAAYGATLLLRPAALISPAHLPDTSTYRRLARAVGLRDTISGLALIATASRPDQARWAVRARVLADTTDVIVFGTICPRDTKAKAMAIAAGYGLLSSLTHPRTR